MEIKRRDFLKLVGGATAGAALSGWSLHELWSMPERPGEYPFPGPRLEHWVRSVCQECAGGCGIMARVIDGKVVKIEGNPLHPVNRGALCPKGHAGVERLYHPDRILGPLLRSGDRGAGKWQKIPWNEALEIVVAKLKEIRNQNRPHGLVLINGKHRGLMDRLLARFAEAFGTPNYIRADERQNEQLAYYLTQGVTEQVGYDLEHSNYILSFGSPFLESGPSPVWFMSRYGHLRQGRRGQRAKVVQIDTRCSVTAAKADEWIPVEPGAEGVLALGIAHVIINEGLYDRDFVARETFGFENWRDEGGREHVGFRTLVLREYTPGIVSDLAGVPIETIIKLAREFAAQKPAIALGDGMGTRYSNGIYNLMAVHCLNALVGSIDRPGGVILQKEIPFSP
ncbi:MAG: molybdopterin-dependent oxidoreductase, partial [bacterium]